MKISMFYLAKLTVSTLLNMNEIYNLNKLQSRYFDEILKNLQNINDRTNLQSLLCHITNLWQINHGFWK
jgi:hypothetical protein